MSAEDDSPVLNHCPYEESPAKREKKDILNMLCMRRYTDFENLRTSLCKLLLGLDASLRQLLLNAFPEKTLNQTRFLDAVWDQLIASNALTNDHVREQASLLRYVSTSVLLSLSGAWE